MHNVKGELTKLSLRDAQLVMLDILKEVHRVCEENDIKYFIVDGTLLGAVRHGGFIPWDDDLDIAMSRVDYEKFRDIAKDKLNKEYFLQTVDTDENYKLYHIPMKVRRNNTRLEEFGEDDEKYHMGIYIDIFPYDPMPKSRIKKFLYKDLTCFILKCKYDAGRMKSINAKYFIRKLLNIMTAPITYKVIYKFVKKHYKWGIEDSNDYYNYGGELIWNKDFNKEDFFPVKLIEFEGEQFYGPNRPHSVLEKIYGDYMKLPPEDERTWHAKNIYIIK